MENMTDNNAENSVAVIDEKRPEPAKPRKTSKTTNSGKKKLKSKGKKLDPKTKNIIAAACGIAAVLLVFVGLHHVKTSFQKEKSDAYNGIYQIAFDSAEKRNHVSNDAIISVTEARELSRLEVLTVTDSEFVIKDEDETDKNTSWLEVQGTGVFTVDLSAGEFIVDPQRKYVHVVIPAPVLTECTVSGTGRLFQRNGEFFTNGSAADGVRLAQAQMSEGRTKLEDTMKQSRLFHNAARDAAVQVVEDLVLQWNPNVPDLQVDVEFSQSA